MKPNQHHRTAPRWFLGAVLGLCLPGCAFGHYGTLMARRTLVKGAEIVDVHAIGLLVRPSKIDGGLSVGYRHATYIFPRKSTRGEHPVTECFLFHAPLGTERPLLRASTTIGLELQCTPELKRLSLGYLAQVLTDGGGTEESRIVRLHFDPRNPRLTTLEMKTLE